MTSQEFHRIFQRMTLLPTTSINTHKSGLTLFGSMMPLSSSHPSITGVFQLASKMHWTISTMSGEISLLL